MRERIRACVAVKLAARAGYSRSRDNPCDTMGAHRWIGGAFRMEQLKVIGTEDDVLVLVDRVG